MVQREDSPLNALGATLPIVDSAVIPATEASNQRNASVSASEIPSQSLTPFAQKADAVLKDELGSHPNRRNKIQQEDHFPTSQDLKSSAQALGLQASEIVDGFVKGANLTPEQVPQIASPLCRNEELNKECGSPPLPLTFLKVLAPINPGQTGHIDFSLINEDTKETANYRLYATDLISKSGHRIPDSHINVSPNSGKIMPGESVDGRIEIRIPTSTPSDDYSGLLQTEDDSWLQAVIKLSVGA